MTRSRWRSFRETFFVLLLVVVYPIPAILAPPDPFTQIRYAAGSLVAALAVAVALVYGLDYYRIRFRIRSIGGIWLTMLAGGAATQRLLATGDVQLDTGVGVCLGLFLGVWLVYHDGLVRLRESV